MGRWGQAVKINDDPQFDSGSPTDKSVQVTKSILEEMALLFQSARNRYELTKDQQNLGLLEDENMRSVGRALHRRLKDIVRQRQKQTSLVKKTTWGLHDGKVLENIASKIAEFVDALEDVFPAEDVHRKLVKIEIDEMDEPSLILLKDAARGIDTALSDAAGQKINLIAGRNPANKIESRTRRPIRWGQSQRKAGPGCRLKTYSGVRDFGIRQGRWSRSPLP
ncbi:prion-inhibition and propagation-domain-containing protein [Truncatella angustata]|uniref:Prion-inhibition and propagation-domain-containing protein n=1 Tax=Truncatella angustata TaxID=152316 RepID=A0A9P8RK63_9PEZI|nr:prion-inhibition and propagation-domain-containing protein [Truncatella angustata]KAH6647326.1 prion-inhibition and propagation-domain-containing protein [Truncatella angustata]